MINLIFAIRQDGAFGSSSKRGLPWPYIEEDMQTFVSMTGSMDVIVVGSATWAAMPPKARERLSNKQVLVAGRSKGQASFDEIHAALTEVQHEEVAVAIIGGAKVLKEFSKYADYAHVTIVRNNSSAALAQYEHDVVLDLHEVLGDKDATLLWDAEADLRDTSIEDWHIVQYYLTLNSK